VAILHERQNEFTRQRTQRQNTRKSPQGPKPRAVVVPTESDLPESVVRRLTELEQEQDAIEKTLPDYVRKLTSGYKRVHADFEIFECFRKLALVCMPVAFEPGSVPQLIFGLMVCFITFGLYAAISPFAEERSNVLASMCQVQIFFALLSAIAISFSSSGTAQSMQSIDVLLTFLTFMPFAITILLRTPLVQLLEAAGRRKAVAALRRTICGVRTPEEPPLARSTAPDEPAKRKSTALFTTEAET
jgi:hypothetical protein